MLPSKNIVTSLHQAAEANLTITTLSSRELNQDVGRAKRAAKRGPVFITDRGKPSHVLLTIDDYTRLSGQGRTLIEVLSMPGLADIDFDPPSIDFRSRPADFS